MIGRETDEKYPSTQERIEFEVTQAKFFFVQQQKEELALELLERGPAFRRQCGAEIRVVAADQIRRDYF